MTIGAALSEGLQVTIVGIAIVFAVLVILMFVLMGMKTLFYNDNSKKEQNTPSNSNKTLPQAANATAKSAPEMDEGELIAVLTAAIAASLNTSSYNLNIKSYRRVGNALPSWSKAGLTDVINSRF